MAIGLVSDDGRTAFAHIPKTGGTWLAHVLGMRHRDIPAEATLYGVLRDPVEWHLSSYWFFVCHHAGPHPIWWAASDGGRRSADETIRALYDERRATADRALRRAARLSLDFLRVVYATPDDILGWRDHDGGLLTYHHERHHAGAAAILRLETIVEDLARTLPLTPEQCRRIQDTPPINVTTRPRGGDALEPGTVELIRCAEALPC